MPAYRAHGAVMLSVLLGCAFLSRQFWGLVADRVSGLGTVLAGSVCQITAMTGFLLTQDEAGLFAVAGAFGLGFAGITPAYVVAIRELFPAAEASWRVPTQLLFLGFGMATGSWLAGVIYDHFGFCGAAFGTGIVFNAANPAVIGTLVLRWSSGGRIRPDRGCLPERQSRNSRRDKSKFRQSEVPNWSICRPPSPRPAKTR